MKTAPSPIGSFYMKHLLVFACFFSSLLIGPAVVAQTQKVTTTKDNKYGEGGTKKTLLDEESRISYEAWIDKNGVTKETHSISYNGNGIMSQSWSFFTSAAGEKLVGATASFFMRLDEAPNDWHLHGSNDLGDIKSYNVDHLSKQDCESFIQKCEKQFAKTGEIRPSDFKEEEVEAPKPPSDQEKPKVVDTNVGQPDLDKQFPYTSADQAKADAQKRAEVKAAEEAKADAQKRAEFKIECNEMRAKIRTLQDLLRARQADPASPKQELETIRKQIDGLLDRLADCLKPEPIDVQFDCLKSKFPDVKQMRYDPTWAVDFENAYSFEWDKDKQAWIDRKTKESICPPSGIDPCLVGTWECTSFKEANQFITGGGTGFRVTFKSDGTETVDYSKMQRIRAQHDEMVYEGKATAQISTKNGVAKIEKIIDAGAKFNAIFMAKKYGREGEMKIPLLGPGGLGSTKGKNNYKCTENSLEYQSSTPRGDADCTVKLTKVKP